MTVASRFAPSKNSTFAIVPSVSLALAVIGILAGATKVLLLAGLVILTVGGRFGLTVTPIALEVVLAPRLSVATAVKL